MCWVDAIFCSCSMWIKCLQLLWKRGLDVSVHDCWLCGEYVTTWLECCRQWLAADPRAVPRVGQRVPYVIVAGPPGLPLIRLVRSPECLLRDPSLKINAEYYISRVIIPPLERCFSLIGANIASWSVTIFLYFE